MTGFEEGKKAKATTEADPYGMTTKNGSGKSNDKGNCSYRAEAGKGPAFPLIAIKL